MPFCFLTSWSHFWENLWQLRMNTVFINWYISVIAFVTMAPGSVLVSEYHLNVYFGVFVHCVENISVLVFIYSFAVHFWSISRQYLKSSIWSSAATSVVIFFSSGILSQLWLAEVLRIYPPMHSESQQIFSHVAQ